MLFVDCLYVLKPFSLQISGFINLENQGQKWPGEMLPEEAYVYSFIPQGTLKECNPDDPNLEWHRLGDGPESIITLVQWLYIFYVLGNGDRTVICWEEPVFYISNATFDDTPWCAKVHVFDVREQMEGVFLFRLAQAKN